MATTAPVRRHVVDKRTAGVPPPTTTAPLTTNLQITFASKTNRLSYATSVASHPHEGGVAIKEDRSHAGKSSTLPSQPSKYSSARRGSPGFGISRLDRPYSSW